MNTQPQIVSAAELHQVLEQEAGEYRRLVDLTRREQTALLAGNLEDLTTTIQAKNQLLPILDHLAALRERLTSGLIKQFHLPTGATLTDLIAHFEDSLAQQLISLRNEFVELVEALITLNYRNRLLIQTELVQVESTFDYMRSMMVQPDTSYSATPKKHPQSSTGGGNLFSWQI